jgi:hypothetical protein
VCNESLAQVALKLPSFAPYKEASELRGLPWPKARALVAKLLTVYPKQPDLGHRLLLGLLYESRLPTTEEATPNELLEWLEIAVLKPKPYRSPIQFVYSSLKDRCVSWQQAKKRGAEFHDEFTTPDPLLPLSGIEAMRSLSPEQQETLGDYLEISRDIESDPTRADESVIATLAAFWGVKPRAAEKRLERARQALKKALETFL